MAHEFKNILDDAVKSVASKKDIDSIKNIFGIQSDMIKVLGLKITNLEEKGTANEEAKKASPLQVEAVYLETQDNSKTKENKCCAKLMK